LAPLLGMVVNSDSNADLALTGCNLGRTLDLGTGLGHWTLPSQSPLTCRTTRRQV